MQMNPPLLLLVGAVIGWYVAVRVLSGLLAWRIGSSLARAVGAVIPVAALVTIALIRKDHAMAISAIFASSVAAMSLVLGSVLISSPTRTIVDAHQREWSFILPAALVLLLMGLKAQFTLGHALILLAVAGVIALLWTDPRRVHPVSTSVEIEHPPISPVWSILLRVMLAIGLCVIAGLLASTAAATVSSQWRLPGNGFITAVLIGPAMMLPLVGVGTQLAHEHRQGETISTVVAVVLINLLLLLPVVVLTTWIRTLEFNADHHTSQPLPQMLWMVAEQINRAVLTYPHTTWRVDTMMILILSIGLVPLSLNRWIPSRLEGMMLIGAYVCYLLMSAFSATVG